MKTFTRFLLNAIGIAAIASLGVASQVSDQGEHAVRQLIKSKTKWDYVFYTAVRETGFGRDVRISGEGVATDKEGWRGLPFKFSVRVSRDESSVRDADVDFANGFRINSPENWVETSYWDGRDVSIDGPRWYDTLRSGTIIVRGTAKGSSPVKVMVYNKDDRQVESVTARPNPAGKWVANFRLQNGTYRMVATRDRWSNGDEVRFNVGRSNRGWGDTKFNWSGGGASGWGNGFGGSGGSGDREDEFGGSGGSGGSLGGGVGPGLTIDKPRDRQKIDGPRFTAEGKSRSEFVELVLMKDGREWTKSRVKVERGKWKWSTRLGNGPYELEILDGRNRRTVRFVMD